MIGILMATYNGERYVAEQIESLLRQTEQGFRLYIRDDGSTDGTCRILDQYAKEHPDQIFVQRNAVNSGGAKYNFLHMILDCKEDYLMLCDQDDVWLPDKIRISMREMKRAEGTFGKRMPLLVHTDLCVTDEMLCTTHPSFFRMERIDCTRTELKDQVVKNTITGCTTMINRALADFVHAPLPEFFIMHDWWLGLIAAAFGRILPLMNSQPILYRQHGNNTLGAQDALSGRYIGNRLLHRQATRKRMEDTYRQADAFCRIYAAELSAEQADLLQAYCAIPMHNKVRRILDVLRLRTFQHGLLRRIGQLLYI